VAKTRLVAVLGVLSAAFLAMGCAWPGARGPSDEEQALRLLRDYEAAIDAYDADAATALLSDDYVGFRGSGKEGVARLVDMLKQQGGALELDLTNAVVTVEGGTAKVAPVVSLMGQWESTATYVLTRTDKGWRIKGVEMQR
jgi:ketosteroid isomerase-like protein